jgi:hypothetical protein
LKRRTRATGSSGILSDLGQIICYVNCAVLSGRNRRNLAVRHGIGEGRQSTSDAVIHLVTSSSIAAAENLQCPNWTRCIRLIDPLTKIQPYFCIGSNIRLQQKQQMMRGERRQSLVAGLRRRHKTTALPWQHLRAEFIACLEILHAYVDLRIYFLRMRAAAPDIAWATATIMTPRTLSIQAINSPDWKGFCKRIAWRGRRAHQTASHLSLHRSPSMLPDSTSLVEERHKLRLGQRQHTWRTRY